MDGSTAKLSQRCHKGGMDGNTICHVTINHVFFMFFFHAKLANKSHFVCSEISHKHAASIIVLDNLVLNNSAN